MRSKIAAVVIVIALAWGLEQVVVSPLETGAAYPEYSSLRSDPMGTMALYESLAKVSKVERLYKSRMKSDPGPATTIFVLGVEPVAWSKLKEDTLKEYEELTSKGARLVIAFLPVSQPWKDSDERPVEGLWNIHFRYNGLRADHGEIPRDTALELEGGPEWKENGAALERSLGKGSVVLLAESYPLSNEGLREEHDTDLIVRLAGQADEIVFDENHFGVVETGSISKLMRKYHLEGAIAVLALVAGLFLWRSASSLLPSRAPRSEEAVMGRDSLEGMTALLRRGISEGDLVKTCVEVWSKTAKNEQKTALMSIKNGIFDDKNIASAYREIAKALVEKT
jgi:hypothetical protein